MTSRAMVSPSSKTEWIIFRSSDSITADASAMSTSSRSSVSVENGPSRKPRPGVMALPIMIRSFGNGPRIRVSAHSGDADGDQQEGCDRAEQAEEERGVEVGRRGVEHDAQPLRARARLALELAG